MQHMSYIIVSSRPPTDLFTQSSWDRLGLPDICWDLNYLELENEITVMLRVLVLTGNLQDKKSCSGV